MIEYIDLELIKALFMFSLVLVVITGASFSTPKRKKSKQLQSSKKSTAKYYWFAYVLFIATVIFLQADSSMMQAKENIKNFRGAKVLCCTTQNGRDSSSKYRVSIKDGWEVDERYFIKDSLMIRADKCEEM